ncbi:hypothetical protein DY000_02041125 [Brassica cretica]|uniref:Uncharacterized protein n=1 Tax=Brassica cretica TaxID=69181 RepID=A0ABQ7BDS7_BRACR|nr:hypothetical protein DY000_02041125 [Brassica cretica]
MVLIFHSFKGFSDLDLDMKVFQIWKTSGMTYQKSSDGVFSYVSPFHNRSERFGFSDLENFWDDLLVSRLKYNALDDFQEVPDDFQEVF